MVAQTKGLVERRTEQTDGEKRKIQLRVPCEQLCPAPTLLLFNQQTCICTEFIARLHLIAY